MSVKWTIEDFIDKARLLTWPVTILCATLLTVLLWIYMDDRGKTQESIKTLQFTMQEEFKEARSDMKEMNKSEIAFREDTTKKLALFRGVCCSEIPIAQRISDE